MSEDEKPNADSELEPVAEPEVLNADTLEPVTEDSAFRRVNIRPDGKQDITEFAFTPEQMADALEKCHGFVSTTARMLKCHPQTVRNYMARYPEVAAARKEARETVLDAAEISLIKAVNERQGWAVCFLLKTQAKDRGYIERQQFESVGVTRDQLFAVMDKVASVIRDAVSDPEVLERIGRGMDSILDQIPALVDGGTLNGAGTGR